MMLLDPRLSLALRMYDKCALAADIGTDHALLPAALLLSGRCDRMIVTDRSPSALAHAKAAVSAYDLDERVSVRLGDGLEPIEERCSMISIMGMGGKNISEILKRGSDRLHGATLLLSCHSDLPTMRQGIMEAGYHITEEEPCRSSGRYYLIIKAEEGAQLLTGQQLRTGVKLLSSGSPDLKGYLTRQRNILYKALSGVMHAAQSPEKTKAEMKDDLRFYDNALSDIGQA